MYVQVNNRRRVINSFHFGVSYYASQKRKGFAVEEKKEKGPIDRGSHSFVGFFLFAGWFVDKNKNADFTTIE